jgi:two-component system, sensor histidine kinase
MGKRKTRKRSRQRPRKARPRAGRPPSARAVEAALAGIAHDIRTPLTGILALAELLASSDLGKRERDWANAVKSGAEHLASLTSLIVDAAKADVAGLTLRHEPFSPRALAEAVGQAMSARAGNKGIETEIAIAADLPAFVAGDAPRLRAALENLIDNAVKFTGDGTVVFGAGAAPAEGARVRLTFTVADSGIGIAARDIKKLFHPFAQASEQIAHRYGGAGLGLVFVKRIAKAMGGDLTLTSEPGRGTTFRLVVTVEHVAAPPAAERSGAHAAPARTLTVLCVEDNPYGRVVMNTILTELGHRVDFAESGEAAVAAAARGGYDAVLMDLALPGIDGLEATRAIRALPGAAAQVPVIGISGHSESDNEAAARLAGVNYYFVKPISPGKLAEALANISDEHKVNPSS